MKPVLEGTLLKTWHSPALLMMVVCVFAAAPLALAAPTFTDFDSFVDGTIDGQSGWRATGAFLDEAIVDLGGGDKVWRVSNAATSGSFSDQPFAPGTDLYAGEPGALHDYDSAVSNTNLFYSSFDFWSVTGAAQPGLAITVSPDDGSGRRHSFLRLVDSGTGIDVVFFDTADNHPVTNANGGFVSTTVATGLSYTQVHTIAIDMEFVPGNMVDGGGLITGNDIVKILINGAVVHTGTSWESYWQTSTEGQTPPAIRAVDTLLFRISGTAAPATAGSGFYIDNLLLTNVPVPASVPAASTLAVFALTALLLLLTGLAAVVRRNHTELQQAQ